MEYLKPSPTELAYLAGYFDGEGCVSFSNNLKKYPTLRITLVTGDVIPMAMFTFAFGGKLHPTLWDKKPHKRQLYYWMKHGKEAQKVLRALLPYLHAKLEVASLALKPNYETWGHGKKMPKEEFDLRCRVKEEVSKINNRVTMSQVPLSISSDSLQNNA